MTAEWILAMIGIMTLLGGLIAVLWKLAMGVGRLTQIVGDMASSQQAQWGKIDNHDGQLKEHDGRIIRIETIMETRNA
jgi:hypothetical protein